MQSCDQRGFVRWRLEGAWSVEIGTLGQTQFGGNTTWRATCRCRGKCSGGGLQMHETASCNHLVRTQQQRQRDRQAERLRRLEVMQSAAPCGQPRLRGLRHLRRKGFCRQSETARADAAGATAGLNGVSGASFNHLIRAQQNGWRDLDAKRLRGLLVDDQFEQGRLLHRNVGRLGAAQDLVDDERRAADLVV